MRIFTAVMALSLCLTASAFAVPELRAAPARDTLVLWTMDDGVNSGFVIQKMMKRFTQQTGIPVRTRFLSWSTAFDELNRALAANIAADSAKVDSVAIDTVKIEVPDVIQLGSTWVPYFAHAGLISPIDKMLDMVDTSRFYAEAMKATHVGSNSVTYSVPWFLDVRGYFVNERLWVSMGFNEGDVETYPKFLGTLRSIAQAHVKNDANKDVAPFEFGAHEDWSGSQQMAPILWNFGGDIVVKNELGNGGEYRSALTDSLTLVGLRHYLKFLRDVELAPHSLKDNSSESAARFTRSELMIHYGTSEIIRKIEFNSDEGGLMESPLAKDGIAVVVGPRGPAGCFTFVGGSHLAIPSAGAYNRHKRGDAESLFLYMLRADNVDYYSRQIGFLPADRGLIRIWAQDSRYYRLIQNLEESARSFVNIPEWSLVESEIVRMVNGIGEALRDSAGDATEQIVRHVIVAHNRVNKILGHADSEDGAALESRVRLSLMQPVEEEVNEMREATDESLRTLYVALVTAFFIVLVAGVIVCIRYRLKR